MLNKCFTSSLARCVKRFALRHKALLKAIRGDDVHGFIEQLRAQGVTVFRNGGAIGFDTVSALKVIEAKKQYPRIRLEMYLPCRNQSDYWSDVQKEIYRFILSQADRVVYISEHYTRFCMLERDRRMVDGSDLCIAYCLHSDGGTGYTCKYALKQNVPVLNLADRLPKVKG